MRQSAMLALLLVIGGCSGARRSIRTAEVAEKTKPLKTLPALSQEDTKRIVTMVSGARSLLVKREVKVQHLAPDEFRKELTSRIDEPPGKGEITFDQAFLAGFDFLPPPDKRDGIAGTDELLLDQIAAFYDTKKDAVFMQRARPASEKDAFVQRAVLAHEVHHALQAQNFTLTDPSKLSQDAALARLSLIEGDAMVAMGAYIGLDLGAPVGRTLRRIREATANVPREAIGHEAKASSLHRAIELSRERLSFPYEAGMAFVADVYRTGGFPLVDKMYSRIPTTTEQILHPEKYLAGEDGRPFGELPAITGLTVLGSDVMGELQTRILLQRCNSRAVAEKSAAGWGGDRFFVLGTADKGIAIAWASSWDSEAEAVELETSLASSTGCFSDNSIGEHRISKAFQVKRRGAVVAFVRGVDAKLQQEVLGKLLALPGKQPAAVAFTKLTIPPRVTLPEPEKGSLDGDVYRNEWLGIVGRVPEGMKARLDDTNLDFFIERPGAAVSGALAVSTRLISDELNEKTFSEVESGFVRAMRKHGLSPVRLGGGEVKTSLGNGIDRTWQVRGTQIQLRTVLIPICAGTGAIIFAQAYGDSFAKSVLDGWLDSFRLTNGRNMRACDYLDPK